MGSGMVAQYVVIALAVIASLVIVMRSQFPAATRKLRVVLALPLLREGMPGWTKSLGRRLAPAPRGGGIGCGGCDNCD